MENPGETPNTFDSQEAVGAASSILQNGHHPASEFPRTMPMSDRQFHIPHSVGTPLYGYPNYNLGNFSLPISTGSIPFLPGAYPQPSFGYHPLPGHLSRPDIPEAPYPVAGSSSVARADRENVQVLPIPTGGAGRQNSAGRGSSSRARPNGGTKKKKACSSQKQKASRPNPSPENSSPDGSAPCNVGSDGPHPSVGPSAAAAVNGEGEFSEGESDDDGASGRARWENWEVNLLIEAKKLEYAVLDRSTTREVIATCSVKWQKIADQLNDQGVLCSGNRCKNKWNELLRAYKRINDHQKNSGVGSYASMTLDQRKAEKLPATFEEDWRDLLDTFMKDRPCQNPPFVADSSAVDSAIDDSENQTVQEKQQRMSGKRKRAVGENTRYLVGGIQEGMESLANVMMECEKLRSESDDKQSVVMSQNCDKICDVLKFLASAVVGVNPRTE